MLSICACLLERRLAGAFGADERWIASRATRPARIDARGLRIHLPSRVQQNRLDESQSSSSLHRLFYTVRDPRSGSPPCTEKYSPYSKAGQGQRLTNPSRCHFRPHFEFLRSVTVWMAAHRPAAPHLSGEWRGAILRRVSPLVRPDGFIGVDAGVASPLPGMRLRRARHRRAPVRRGSFRRIRDSEIPCPRGLAR